jgi:hypothetical protein
MKAITHPGSAHADDVLSAALLIARGVATSIERREPTEDELNDPGVLVFDIGGRHEPELNNFDHHQFPADAPPACAMTLLLRHVGEYRDWAAVFPWVTGTEKLDSKGPFAVAKELGVEWDDTLPYTSCPFAGFVIRQFAAESVITDAYPLWKMLRGLGEHLMLQVIRTQKKWKHFDKTTQWVQLGEIRVAVMQTTGAEGIDSWLNRYGYTAHCIVSSDDRGEGLSLYRRNDDPRIDFTRCRGMSNCMFVHANGFIAKTSNREWRTVLQQAIVPAPA